VRRLPEASATETTIHADLDVECSGHTAHYKDVPFQVSVQGNEKKLTGSIPCKLTDFKIDPPTLLTMPIKNDIPVKVEMTWQESKE
jgi:hypothetical protein